MMTEAKSAGGPSFAPPGPRSDDPHSVSDVDPTTTEMIAAAVEAEALAVKAEAEIDDKIIAPMKKDTSPAAQLARRHLMYRAVFGEFMGTTLFLAPIFCVIVNCHRQNWDVTNPLGTSAMVAFTVLLSSIAAIYSFSGVSGAHLNPAVTFGAWLTKKTSNRKLVLYIVAQFAASLNCMVIVSAIFPNNPKIYAALTVSPPYPMDDIVRVFFMEFFLTWTLIYVAFTVAYEDAEAQKKSTMSFKTIANTDGLTIFSTTPQSKTGFAPFAIGFTLAALAMMGGSVSGGCFNPARYFGPAVFAGQWDYVFVYWVAELLGGGSAALFIHFVHPLGKVKEESSAETSAKAITDKIRKATFNAAVAAQMSGRPGKGSVMYPRGLNSRNIVPEGEEAAQASVTVAQM